MVALKYHQPTFDLLKIEPEIDPAAVAALDALEKRRSIKLPASVREWYSIKDAEKWLAGNDNALEAQDFLGSIGSSGGSMADVEKEPDSLDRRRLQTQNFRQQMINAFHYNYPNLRNLLGVVIENQGVCYWAVKLDDGDDPPVLLCYSHEENWQRFCDTFSHFCFMRVWDWAEHFPYWLEVSNFPVTAKMHNALAQIYRQKSMTHANNIVPNMYRYGSEHIHILVYEPRFHDKARSWVMLMAASGDDILAVAKLLFSEGDLPDMFWLETDLNTANPIDKEQEALLKQIREWKAGL
jgi:hypothetical protein